MRLPARLEDGRNSGASGQYIIFRRSRYFSLEEAQAERAVTDRLLYTFPFDKISGLRQLHRTPLHNSTAEEGLLDV